MKQTFKVKNLDCANCAARLEKAINKLPDVDVAVVSFATEKLMLEAADDKFDAVVANVEATMKELEPDWVLEK
ncbi:MAG: cation transporter [Bacillota bacterium]|nr:cation transporter [Bacillota bacterium]